MSRYDVLFLGGGGAAEMAAPILAEAGRSVAIIEALRVGGECPYVACMPSKALLRSASIRSLIGDALDLGASAAPIPMADAPGAWDRAWRRRDGIAEQRSDRGVSERLEGLGIRILRGQGRVLRPGAVEASGETVEYVDLVLNTGSRAVRPDIDGLDRVPTWSSDEALSSPDLPVSLLVIGGSAVACELAQVYARFGSRVTLLERSSRLLLREEPQVGRIIAQALAADGVDVRCGISSRRARAGGAGAVLELDDGTSVGAERVILATGRRPNLQGLGLEMLGIAAGDGGVAIEPSCRVRGESHVWAAGDCVGVAPYTHTANYHGRAVAANILGGDVRCDHRAIPRGTYTDPSVCAVGLTERAASQAGLDVVAASMDLTDTARAATDGVARGWAQVVVDRARGVVVGAACVAPHAEEMIGEMVLAIRAEIPIEILSDVIHPFPSLAEVWEPPVRELAESLRR